MANPQPKIQIQIVAWNSMKFLPDCLTSIFNQTYKNFSVLIIDNASNDGMTEFVKINYPQIKIFRNNKNVGFTAAHNQGIKITSLNKDNVENNYILVINADIILEEDYLKKIVTIMEKDKEIGGMAGKILKVYTSDPELNEKNKTQNIDSTGLKIYRSKKVIDRGENETDHGQYNNEGQVFGISGACALYRLSALEDIKIPIIRNSYIRNELVISRGANEVSGEYFDEDFFAYKDDIDLSYRLRWRGWKIYYYPTAVCYHHRQVFGGQPKILDLIKRRRARSPLIKIYSYRNDLFLLIKNVSFSNFLKDFPFIFFYELKKFLYIIFFEPKTLGALKEVFAKMGVMIKKRRFIMKNKKINSKEMRQWFY